MQIPTPRSIDLQTYPRREFFHYFNKFDVPINSRTVQLEFTKAKHHIKRNKFVLSQVLTTLIAKAANSVDAFRQRIVGDGIEEYDFVVPCYTTLTAEKSVSFVIGAHADSFRESYFANLAIREEALAGRQKMQYLPNEGYVIVSIIPWYSFTSMTLPYSRAHASVPTISIGKFYDQSGTTLIPVAINSNHALIDGYHVGQFLDCLTTAFSDPETHMKLSG